MQDSYTALASISGGRVTIRNPHEFGAALQRFKDGEVAVTIAQISSRNRSVAQNSRYWLILTAIAADTGQDKDSLHAYFRARFLSKPFELANKDGELIAECQVGGSTTRLTPAEFTTYMDQVEAFARDELGFVV